MPCRPGLSQGTALLPARVYSRSSANTGVCAQEAIDEQAINGGCREAEASTSTQGGEEAP